MSSRSSSVVEQYARAIVEVLESRSPSERGRVESELAAISNVVRESGELVGFLRNPVVEPRRKLHALSRLFPGIQPLSHRYLEILIRRGRADLLPEIWTACERLRDERRQVLVAELTSATPLGRDTAKRYERSLAEATGREVRIEFRQDPSLLGGLRTRMGSQVYDSSVSARLEMMRRSLLSE